MNRVRTIALALGMLSAAASFGQGYDVFVYDQRTGVTSQLTTLAGVEAFNPDFSNNGRTVVHDVVSAPGMQDLWLTDVRTGVSTPLAGGEGGNDAAWSPDGAWIAFDRSALIVPDSTVYVVPAGGGARVPVRINATDPDWNADATRLVFTDETDGSVRTVEVASGSETIVAAVGLNPSWSRNGRFIAYSDGDNLFVQEVDALANPVGSALQVTFDPPSSLNQQPSWSGNGKTLVFHSSRGGVGLDLDIWSVPADGSAAPTLLAARAGDGDFDPVYSRNGQLVAYAAVGLPGPSPASAARPAALQTAASRLAASSYPNPFNPRTTIRFALPEQTQVRVQVYDALGHAVRTLVDGFREAGVHDVVFDAAHLPSGSYVYVIEAGGDRLVHQLILVK